jgi:ABC-2 type transport system permease protein
MSRPLTGAVYDRGYRPYEGTRGGQRAAVYGLYKASIRRALGIRRSWRQKVAPFVLLGVVVIPAVVQVGIGYVTKDRGLAQRFEIVDYRRYVGVSTALMLFVALTAPDIMCPDRRQRVLPLIFARPLTGKDYVLAKLGAMASIVFAFGFIPQVVLFIGQTLVADSALTYVRDNADVLWKVPVSVAILAIFYAVLGVAAASLATRRIAAGAGLIGFFLVTSTAAGLITGTQPDGSAGALLNIWSLPLRLRDLVFLGHLHEESRLDGVQGAGAAAVAMYIAFVALGVLVLLRRYRWVER